MKKKIIRAAGNRWIVKERQEDGTWFTILTTTSYQRAATKLAQIPSTPRLPLALN